MLIGILSDTHGLLRQEVIDGLERVDHAYEDGTTELFHDELVVDTLFETIQEKLDRERIASALKKLTEVQRRRVIMYFFEDFTIRNKSRERLS